MHRFFPGFRLTFLNVFPLNSVYMDFIQGLAAFLVVSFLVTQLFKRYTKFQTHHLITLIRTRKPLPIFNRLAKIGKPLEWFAELGLVLGFGGLAVDYLYLRGRPLFQRLAFFGVSVAALFLVFYGIDFALAGMISGNPAMKPLFWLFSLGYGLLGFAGFTILALIAQAADILAKLALGKKACPGVAPLIPGVEIPNVPLVVPMHAWLSLLIILLVHEGMHGILARREKIKVKSTGLLLFGFLPMGAFVEPDDKELKAAPDRSQLRLYAAGPTANLLSLVVIQVFVLLLAGALALFINPWALDIHKSGVSHVIVDSVSEDFSFCGDTYAAPARGALEKGMVIKAINGKPVQLASDVSSEIALNKFKPMTFVLGLADGREVTKTMAPNELGLFGFVLKEVEKDGFEFPQAYTLYRLAIGMLFSFLNWLFILNFLVATVNFLPLGVFDGGRIAQLLFLPYLGFLHMPRKDAMKLIGRLFLIPLAFLFVLNALPLFL